MNFQWKFCLTYNNFSTVGWNNMKPKWPYKVNYKAMVIIWQTNCVLFLSYMPYTFMCVDFHNNKYCIFSTHHRPCIHLLCLIECMWFGKWVSISISLCLNCCIYIIGNNHLWCCNLWNPFKHVLLFLKFGFNLFGFRVYVYWFEWDFSWFIFHHLLSFKIKNHVNIHSVKHSSSCHPMCSQCFLSWITPP
jgi:hypothetical protein